MENSVLPQIIELKSIPSKEEIDKVKIALQQMSSGHYFEVRKEICGFHNTFLDLKAQSPNCYPCIGKAAKAIRQWLSQIEVSQSDSSNLS